MRAPGIFLGGVATGAIGGALLMHAVLQGEPPALHAPTLPEHTAHITITGGGPPIASESSEQPPAPPSAPAPAGASSPPELRADPAWEALVGGMLEQQVASRFGGELTPARKERLVRELARLREASLGLQRTPGDPTSPAELRDRVARNVALLRVDQAFREELGVGVAEFLQGLDAGAVQDVAPDR